MSAHIHSDVQSEFFTPPEFPVEILNEAKETDVIPCCLPSNAKQFFTFMLIKEYYYRTNGALVFIQDEPIIDLDSSLDAADTDLDLVPDNNLKDADKQWRNSIPVCDPPLQSLSSIPVINLRDKTQDFGLHYQRAMRKFEEMFGDDCQSSSSVVILCTVKDFVAFIEKPNEYNNFLSRLRLVIIDNVHEALKDATLKAQLIEILRFTRQRNEFCINPKTGFGKIRMVYLTVPLLHYYGYESSGFWRMEETFRKLEQLCDASVDTSSDIVALLRYCSPLTERVVSYYSDLHDDAAIKLTLQVKERIRTLKLFLFENAFNPVEALGYQQDEWVELVRQRAEAKNVVKDEEGGEENHDESDSLFEEVKNIPQPKTAPLDLLNQFEEILDVFGPWCANRSLYLIISQIKKMKTRVPYVRHYLLLGVLHSRFIMLQALFQTTFSKYDPLEVLERFSSPKLLTVLNILRRFNLTTIHEGKLMRQQEELLQQQLEEMDEDAELTVADYLRAQKQEQASRSSRSRRRTRQRKKLNASTNADKAVMFEETGTKVTESPSEETGSQILGTENEVESSSVVADNVTKIINEEDSKNDLAVTSTEMIGECETSQETANVNGIGKRDGDGSEDQIVNGKAQTGLNEELKVEENEECAKEASINAPKRREKGVAKGKKTAALINSTVQVNVEENHQGTEQLLEKQHLISRFHRRNKNQKPNEDALCGILFLEDRFNARLLYHFLREAAEIDSKLIGLSPTIALPANPEYGKDSREAEIEYKRREENLRKFRYREANFLVGTSLLEDGIELPKANLVIRFDEAKTFRSYLFSKGRAQGSDAEYYILTNEHEISRWLRQLATYKTVEELLLSRTVIPVPSYEPLTAQRNFPLDLNLHVPMFKSATLTNAIGIVNRYCARLPSDTFTRLTPSWSIQTMCLPENNWQTNFSCLLRLPINSPIKWPIKGIPMPTQCLAKKAVAVQTVMVLHKNGELDDALQPVGKEAVPQEPDLCTVGDQMDDDFGEFRPGSTRRRQYYDKQLAPELTKCLPHLGRPFYLYWLRMTLECPLPDDQNTRGRKLHPPEDATQCFGIGLSKPIPPMPPFPIYTRSGEVLVELVRIYDESNLHDLTEERLEKISTFHHYAFTSVLRLDKYLTLFDPILCDNSYYVLPLKACGQMVKEGSVQIDWDFIDRIWGEKDLSNPVPKENESRKDYVFRKEDYVDAVVMPWYRNNDQPQYFYVAEICQNLTPQSQFPGCEFKTFEEYYRKKYKLTIQHPTQPLLDVDHTSARLNFLTPRYVNRKGMALPTSSETTRKAKRENLEQKQILVPELCAIHPFTASLWRQAVCLPCVLYRINALLTANNIRTLVANQIHGLGIVNLGDNYNWKPLSFGWSLGDIFPLSTISDPKNTPAIKDKHKDVKTESQEKPTANLKEESKVDGGNQNGLEEKTKENKTDEKEDKQNEPKSTEKESGFEKAAKEPTSQNMTFAESLLSNNHHKGRSLNEILSEEMKKCRQPQLEIGVWSNDMAAGVPLSEPEYDEEEDELLDPNVALPSNLMMLDKNVSWGGRYKLFNHKVHRALYGSPTHWGEVWDRTAFEPPEDFDDNIDNASIHSDMSGSDESFLDGDNNLKIQFEGNTAEALDKRKFITAFDSRLGEEYRASEDLWWGEPGDYIVKSPEAEEEKLREEFDKRVDIKISEITNIIKWDELGSLPPRIGKKPLVIENEETDITKAYSDLMQQSAPLDPPAMFPVYSAYLTTTPKTLEREDDGKESGTFSFDFQPSLVNHVGPSPCQILQALTMSNANDGLNLERLETIGDSFLKYAITTYLFCTFENIHEGKLSHLRSKQVSNVHLYRLGRKRGLGGIMIATKFEPHDNWLPPCYHIPKNLNKASNKKTGISENCESQLNSGHCNDSIPYNLVTQQSIPDKSIADSVEALIGAYLTSTGPFGALLFMSWLGVRVLPSKVVPEDQIPQDKFDEKRSTVFYMKIPNKSEVILFERLKPPASPLLRYESDCEEQLDVLLKGYETFEESIGYTFRDRGYLLQAFTHASYAANKLTDCYQRLEFLGDAILDYLITRHLYEDPRQHSPGSLTDLRSALVNNTIFASLAVKHDFHKYFRHASPGLSSVLQKFVTFQEQHSHTLTQDYYLMGEEECEEAEDIEVPKALGDVFESVAGAIYLDSNMSLDAVWNVYYRIMKHEIEQFSQNVPKSPIRELLELEPETAKFGKPEKLWDGRRVRVIVEIFGVGVFRGIGRNYRIAKCTAAKCALRHVRKFKQNQKKVS